MLLLLLNLFRGCGKEEDKWNLNLGNLDRRGKAGRVTLAFSNDSAPPPTKSSFYLLCCCFCCLFYSRSLLSSSVSITYRLDTQSIFCSRELSSNSIWNEAEMTRQEKLYISVHCVTRENRHIHTWYTSSVNTIIIV